MRIYKNDAYECRGFSWRPPEDPWDYEPDYDEQYSDDYDSYDDDTEYLRKRRPHCPWPPYSPCFQCPYAPKCPPKRRPDNRRPDCKYPVPYPYPVPCPCPCPWLKCDPRPDSKPDSKPDPKPDSKGQEAFGYFASNTTQGAFPGGAIPFNFSGSLNRNVSLVLPDGTQVRIQVPGIYRVVYSVTTIAAANAALQLLLNDNLVPSSQITIQEGVNSNEIFLRLRENDVLSLNLTGPVTLASGKNASLLLQRI